MGPRLVLDPAHVFLTGTWILIERVHYLKKTNSEAMGNSADKVGRHCLLVKNFVSQCFLIIFNTHLVVSLLDNVLFTTQVITGLYVGGIMGKCINSTGHI